MTSTNLVSPQVVNFLDAILRLLYSLSFVLLAGVIIYLGIIYITAGKEEAIKKVHERWLLLVVGMILVFASLTVPSIIGSIFRP
ncbi:MAG: hypothetical protein NZ822_00860 [Patescibacteria group bacterium]|nr:hypothetical protein [Patescibacteria group bacterium]